MTLSLRRFLYIVTSVIFLLGAPIILAVSFGYSLDLSTRTIIKTGGLMISTTHSDALVAFEGVASGQNPFRKLNIEPGTYPIQITAAGYFPIAFSAPVFAGKATIVDDIELLPLNIDPIAELPAEGFFSSPFRFELLSYRELPNHEFEISLFSSKQTIIGVTNDKPEWVEWSPEHDDALLRTGEKYYFIDTANNQLTGPFSHLRFSVLSPFEAHTFYALSDTAALKISFKNSGIETTPVEKISFSFPAGSIFLSPLHTSIRIFLQPISSTNATPYLDVPNNARITAVSQETVRISFDSTVYFIHIPTGKFFSASSKETTYSVLGSFLGYIDDNEAWILNLKTFEKKFLNRFDSQPQSISLSPKQSVALISFPQSLLSWYLKTPQPVTFPVMTAEAPDTIAVTSFSSKNQLNILKQTATSLFISRERL